MMKKACKSRSTESPTATGTLTSVASGTMNTTCNIGDIRGDVSNMFSGKFLYNMKKFKGIILYFDILHIYSFR